MINLAKTLLISLLLGVSLSSFNNYELSVFTSESDNYVLRCMLMSLIYFFSSLFCYRYAVNALKYKQILQVYLISLLCICMLISSWFNAVFSSSFVYDALISVRSGDGLSWRNIYKSIEIVSLIIVGGNGIGYMVDWLSCRIGRFDVIIKNNININNSQ